MQEEIWKDIEGYENIYQVSNMGRVRSLGFDRWHKGRVLKPSFDSQKHYLLVSLHKDKKSRTKQVHRLVAEAFVPNHSNLPQVNHKDEVKTNNHSDNLEWCDGVYNINYNDGAAMKRAIKTRYERNDVKELVAKTKATKIKNGSYSAERAVNQFTWDGHFVARYISATEAHKATGAQIHVISRCCRGIHKQACGFMWLYDEDVDTIKERTLDAHPNAKKVGQYDLNNNLIKIWNSATDACKTLRISPSSISGCCTGKRNKAKGFVWKFIE